MRRGSGPERLGAAAVLVVVAAISVWSLAPAYRSAPAVAVGYFLIDVGFTVTALLLAAQREQAGNARLSATLAASSLASHLLTRDLGPAGAPAFVFGALTQVLAGMLILRYPRSRFDRPGRRWAQVNLPVAAVFGVAVLVTSRPTWVGVAPTHWWPSIWPNRRLSDHIAFVRSVWRVLAAASFLLLVLHRWQQLARLERRTLAPIMVAAFFGATMVAADLLQWWLPDALVRVIVTARSYTGAVVALAFAGSALQLRLARAAIADLVTDLLQPASGSAVRDALRRALSDDTLEVSYWVPQTGTYVDHSGAGRTVSDSPSRLLLPVRDSEGRPLALIEADASLTRYHDLIDSALGVSRLALENARLQAGLRAQLAEITAARARLLSTGFAQRRQLERDLHDGAQQRLLALGMRLAALETTELADRERATVQAARGDLEQALAELRQLAHGIYPVVLTQGGLAVALEAVADRLPMTVQLDVPASRWPTDVEGVAYLVTCEALTNAVKHSGAGRVSVSVRDDDADLRITVCDDGRGWPAAVSPALPDLTDRVDALGGRLNVSSRPGRTLVVVTLPLTQPAVALSPSGDTGGGTLHG